MLLCAEKINIYRLSIKKTPLYQDLSMDAVLVHMTVDAAQTIKAPLFKIRPLFMV